jgi:hypothetical protein
MSCAIFLHVDCFLHSTSAVIYSIFCFTHAINVNMALSGEDILIPRLGQFSTRPIGKRLENSFHLGRSYPYQGVFLGHANQNRPATAIDVGVSPVDTIGLLGYEASSPLLNIYDSRFPALLYPPASNTLTTVNPTVLDSLLSTSLLTVIPVNSLIGTQPPRIAPYYWSDHRHTSLEHAPSNLVQTFGSQNEAMGDDGNQSAQWDYNVQLFSQPRTSMTTGETFPLPEPPQANFPVLPSLNYAYESNSISFGHFQQPGGSTGTLPDTSNTLSWPSSGNMLWGPFNTFNHGLEGHQRGDHPRNFGPEQQNDLHQDIFHEKRPEQLKAASSHTHKRNRSPENSGLGPSKAQKRKKRAYSCEWCSKQKCRVRILVESCGSIALSTIVRKTALRTLLEQ